MKAAKESRAERKLLHFEGFTLDISKRALFLAGERVRLTPRPLETLIFLVENRGRVSGKQEILDTVWRDTFVTDDVLVQAVKELRRVLGDDKDAPRFIQTVPREGYRFIADTTIEFPSSAEIRERATGTALPALAGQRWLHWQRMSLVVFAGVILVGVLIWILRPIAPATKDGLPPTVGTHSITHLQTGEFPVGKPAFSPDGELILYVGSSRETSGFGDIFVMSTTGGGSTQITRKASPSGDLPVFTADSNHVVFSRPRGGESESRLLDLYSVPSSGGVPKLYLPEASGAGFSPDGKWVAYTKHLPSHRELRVSSTDNLNEYREIAAGAFTPRWSPDGNWISFTSSDPNGGLGDIWILNAQTFDEPKNLTHELQQIYGLTWSANGRSIIFSSKRTGPSLLWMISFADGILRQVVTDIGESAAPSTEPGGKLIFHNVRVINDLTIDHLGNDSEPRQLTNEEFHRWPRLSPSGDKVASIMQRPDFGDHLYLTDIRSGTAVRLSNEAARYPCWIDEGNIAYLSRKPNDPLTNVQVVNVASGVNTPLARFSEDAAWLAVHPGKRKIAVVLSGPNSRQRIIVRDLDSNTDQTIAENAEYSSLRWLPDGSAILWSGPAQASAPASDGVWMYDSATLQTRRLVPDGYGPVWDAKTNHIYFSRSREFSGLWELDPASGKSRKTRTWRELTAFDLAGKRLLFAEGEGRGQIYSLKLDR